MRKYFNIILAVTLIIAGFTACEYSQDVDPVISPDGYPKFTVTPAEDYSNVKEGDTLTYTITLDKMIDRALTFRYKIVDGDANAADFELKPAVIAPYSTSSTLQIIIPQDWDAEETESVKLEFGVFSIAEKYIVNPAVVNPVYDLTIDNYVSDVLTITIGWEQLFAGMEVIDGETTLPNGDVVEWVDTVEAEYDAYDFMDFDILISPADEFDPADPWASEIGNYSGATGNNPEVVEAVLEDGEYILWADLYSNVLSIGFLSLADSTLQVPLAANFQRQGTALNADVIQDDSQAPFGWTLGYDEGGNFQGVIAKLVVENGVYKIVDYEDDTEYGAARKSAKAKTPRPAFLNR